MLMQSATLCRRSELASEDATVFISRMACGPWYELKRSLTRPKKIPVRWGGFLHGILSTFVFIKS